MLQRSVVAAIENDCIDLAQSLLLSLANGRPLPALFTPPVMEALGISVSTAMDRLVAVAHSVNLILTLIALQWTGWWLWLTVLPSEATKRVHSMQRCCWMLLVSF